MTDADPFSEVDLVEVRPMKLKRMRRNRNMEDPFCAISSKEEDVRTLRLIAALLKRRGRCFDGLDNEDSAFPTRFSTKKPATNLGSDASSCALFNLDEDALREVFAHVLKTDAPYSLMALASSCRKFHHMLSRSPCANSTMAYAMACTYRRNAHPVDVLNETLELWQACQLRHACKILHAPLQVIDVASINELDVDLYEANQTHQYNDRLLSWHQKLLQYVPKLDRGRMSVSSLKSISTHYADPSCDNRQFSSSLCRRFRKRRKARDMHPSSDSFKYVTTAMACNCHKAHYAIVFQTEVEVYEFSCSNDSPPSNRTNHCPWTFSWSHVFGHELGRKIREHSKRQELHCYVSGDGSLILLGPFDSTTDASTDTSEWITIPRTGTATTACFERNVDCLSQCVFNTHPWFLTDGTFDQSPVAICGHVFSFVDKTTLEVRIDAIPERSTKFVSQTISMPHVEIENCVRVAISSSGNVFAILQEGVDKLATVTVVFLHNDGTHSYNDSSFRVPFFTCDGFSDDLHLCVSPNGRVLALSAEHDSNSFFLMTFDIDVWHDSGRIPSISLRSQLLVMSPCCDLNSNNFWSGLKEWKSKSFVKRQHVSYDLMMGQSRTDSQGFVDRFLSFSGEWFYAPMLTVNATLLLHVDLNRGPYVLNNFTPCDACMGQRFAAFEANDADTANCFMLYNNADPDVLSEDHPLEFRTHL